MFTRALAALGGLLEPSRCLGVAVGLVRMPSAVSEPILALAQLHADSQSLSCFTSYALSQQSKQEGAELGSSGSGIDRVQGARQVLLRKPIVI